MLPHGTTISFLNESVLWILWRLEWLLWLKWNFSTLGVAITKEFSVWSEVEHTSAEVSSFPSLDLSFLQKQKEEDFASVPSCLEESMLINCLTKDLEPLSSNGAQVTLATESCKMQVNKTCRERKEKNYSWERCISLYLHYYQTDISGWGKDWGIVCYGFHFDFYLSRVRQFRESVAVTPGRNRWNEE